MFALAKDNNGGRSQPPPLPKPLRLADAEKIATSRAESASIASLKKALAGVGDQANPRLSERVDAVLGPAMRNPGPTPIPLSPVSPSVAEAYGAATKLAADATAAAQAVESLKQLLQAQLEAGRPLTTAHQEAHEAHPAAGGPPALHGQTREETMPAPVSPPAPPPPEQRRMDVRGFVAGFIISGAVGAMLYLFMMAG
jgi:hypothetical protein